MRLLTEFDTDVVLPPLINFKYPQAGDVRRDLALARHLTHLRIRSFVESNP